MKNGLLRKLLESLYFFLVSPKYYLRHYSVAHKQYWISTQNTNWLALSFIEKCLVVVETDRKSVFFIVSPILQLRSPGILWRTSGWRSAIDRVTFGPMCQWPNVILTYVREYASSSVTHKVLYKNLYLFFKIKLCLKIRRS
jgi:hypothetical protein